MSETNQSLSNIPHQLKNKNKQSLDVIYFICKSAIYYQLHVMYVIKTEIQLFFVLKTRSI